MTASHITAIRRAAANGRRSSVGCLRHTSREANAFVNVCTYLCVPPMTQLYDAIYHLPDSGRIVRYPYGRQENFIQVGGAAR